MILLITSRIGTTNQRLKGLRENIKRVTGRLKDEDISPQRQLELTNISIDMAKAEIDIMEATVDDCQEAILLIENLYTHTVKLGQYSAASSFHECLTQLKRRMAEIEKESLDIKATIEDQEATREKLQEIAQTPAEPI